MELTTTDPVAVLSDADMSTYHAAAKDVGSARSKWKPPSVPISALNNRTTHFVVIGQGEDVPRDLIKNCTKSSISAPANEQSLASVSAALSCIRAKGYIVSEPEIVSEGPWQFIRFTATITGKEKLAL
jgi:hypothetical protein